MFPNRDTANFRAEEEEEEGEGKSRRKKLCNVVKIENEPNVTAH